MSKHQSSFHADRYGSPLFASLWTEAWGEQYPAEVAPFSSCTYQLLQQLEQQLKLKENSVLVDLGCGAGGVGLWLARKNTVQLIGIDRCDDAVEIATSRAIEWRLSKRAAFSVGDFCNTGLASASVDAVFSIDAFTAAEDIKGALAEVRRILKPRGRFVFTARQLGVTGRHFPAIGQNWGSGLERLGFDDIDIIKRPNVSELWKSVYDQWLKHETELRRELCRETVDALVEEANQGIPMMNDDRPWYLIRAALQTE